MDTNTRYEHQTDRLAFSPDEAARLLGLSRSSLYAALNRGEIRSVRLGGRRLIPRSAIDELLARLQDLEE